MEGKHLAQGGEEGGIPSRTTRNTQEERERTAMARTASLQSFAECSPACRNWPTTTASGQVADDDRDPSCRYCPQFTRRLYWPLLVAWPNLPRANPTLPWSPPRQGSQGRFSTLFGLCGCWSREVQVVEGSWAIPDRPGRSWAVLGCPGLSRLSWVAGCGTFTASDASSQ